MDAEFEPFISTVVVLGSLYFLLGAGFALIVGRDRTVNMAHGGLFAMGVWIGNAVTTTTGSALFAICAAVFCLSAIGAVIALLTHDRAQAKPSEHTLVTLGVALVLSVMSSTQLTVAASLDPSRGLSPLAVILIASVAIVVAIVLRWHVGLSHRQLSTLPTAGLDLPNVDRSKPIAATKFATYCLASAIAGLAGAVVANLSTLIALGEARFLLGAVLTFVIAGCGSIVAVALAAFVVATVDVAGNLITPGWRGAWLLLLIVVVVVARPQGLTRQMTW